MILFIKVQSGVKPKPKAIAIWTQIHNGLADIRQVTQPTVFQPSTSTLTLLIALSDYVMWHDLKQRDSACEWLRSLCVSIGESLIIELCTYL
jgi:hypothetical protein